MQIVSLPSSLTEIDLGQLNQRLRAGEIALDWAEIAVTGVQPAHLKTLLAGLNLTDHLEQLGSTTMPVEVQGQVLAVLQAEAERQTNTLDLDGNLSIEAHMANLTEAPAIWQPEEEPEQEVSIQVENIPEVMPTLPAQPVLPIPSQFQMREELEEMVLRDLLGPAGGAEEEIDEDRVRERYLIGMLAPNKVQIDAEQMDTLALEEEGAEEESSERDVSQRASYSPASLGMSFCIDREATEVLVTISWGQYQRGHSETLKNTQGNPKTVWKRTQRSGQHLLRLREGTVDWYPAEEEQPEVYGHSIVRRSGENWLVSVFLVNGQKEPKKLRDTAWLFQPEVSVAAPDGRPIFQQRISERQHRMSHDERAMAMRYRHHIGFAVGHGVSVHAETLSGDPTRAIRLSTCVAPTHDIPLTEAPTSHEIPELTELVLDMQELAITEPSDLAGKLQPLLSAYQTWIDRQAARLNEPATDLARYQQEAETTLQHCRTTLQRIRAGIDTLLHHPEAAQSFAFMNRAMWLQRIHTIYAQERKRNAELQLGDVDRPENRSWRPFQLAFILLNIPALTDLHHPDRSQDPNAIADLLWFPTGGGKTEAYLGLTAYTLGIRRLQGKIEGRSGEEGVAVIMRYTLRLLTLQQFQRASSLICACEMIRRGASATWGSTPFRLGLWVGMRSTPNTTDDSFEATTQAHNGRSSHFAGVGSPRQLTSCPWCGEAIEDGKNITVENYSRGRARTLIYCSDDYGRCPFSRKQAAGEGLPVLVVDEEIYRLLPSLLIATVDKFAQLPWKGETQMLFGQVEKKCSRHGFRSADLRDSDRHPVNGKLPPARSYEHAPLRPPDLIIQDELHLIAGPLGSLVGLYETVVDHLSTWEVDGRRAFESVFTRRSLKVVEVRWLVSCSILPPLTVKAPWGD